MHHNIQYVYLPRIARNHCDLIDSDDGKIKIAIIGLRHFVRLDVREGCVFVKCNDSPPSREMEMWFNDTLSN